ncbi:hypothetical protein GCM10010145_05970 [Streptomyces ruber]|uniref:Uncharacterized protein n=2 Tax=Streptomyces TaxID=1883 RepID=A0A918B9I8_9ACTN|nr:hypothetical protein [Streptomyces ruber]GGQ40731.1 hypothetical protein GCM10010145_05970 [Streptomyces ruber]
MEQRIGSSNQPLDAASVNAASVNPAYIPGLTSPVPAKPEKAGDVEDKGSPETAKPAEEPETRPDAEPDEQPTEKTDRTDEGQEASDGPVDGPVFEAADRRARIVADHTGVRLALDDQECEFGWDEVGALETETSRFGKLFTVTVHTSDRRWYPIEIEATSRARFKEWDAQLDEVLDAYFEDGETGDDSDAGTEKTTDGTEKAEDDTVKTTDDTVKTTDDTVKTTDDTVKTTDDTEKATGADKSGESGQDDDRSRAER